MTRTTRQATTFFALLFPMIIIASHCGERVSPLSWTVDGFQVRATLRDEARVGRTVFDYTYDLAITNTLGDTLDLDLIASSSDSNSSVLSDAIAIGALASGASYVADKALKIRHDRKSPFAPTAITWVASAAPNARWTDASSIQLTLLQGSSFALTRELLLSRSPSDALLTVSPSLTPLITASLGLVNVEALSLPAVVVFDVPTETEAGEYSGELFLAANGQPLSDAIHVDLVVKAPSLDDIPPFVSQPSSERVVTQAPAAYVSHEVLLGLSEGASIEELHSLVASQGGAFIGSIPTLDLYQALFPAASTSDALDSVIAVLANSPSISLAMRSWILDLHAVPTDPEWERPWDLLSPAGNNWAFELLRFPEAWELSTGSDDLVVAVIDSGFDLAHPDLSPNILGSFDARCCPNTPQAHGTAVAGILAAAANNEIGVSGALWQADVLTYSTGLLGSGSPFLPSVLFAMSDAVDRGARVINFSGGASSDGSISSEASIYAMNRAYQLVLDRHGAAEVAFVFAAGNADHNLSHTSPSSLSASYDNVISVTAFDTYPPVILADYANYGDVTVAASGSSLLTTYPGNRYEVWEPGGTSLAAPMVSGIAGLLFSQDPTLSGAQVKDYIVRGAERGGLRVGDHARPTGQAIQHAFFVANAYESLGLAADALGSQASITIDGDASDWSTVRPRFSDHTGDGPISDAFGYQPEADLVRIFAANNAASLFLLIETVPSATPHSSAVVLSFNSDFDDSTGCNGDEYVLTLNPELNPQASLSDYRSCTGYGELSGVVSAVRRSNVWELSIPIRTLQELSPGADGFSFWAVGLGSGGTTVPDYAYPPVEYRYRVP